MRKYLPSVLTALIIIVGIILGLISGINLSALQKETLKILIIITLSSVLYCFVVGEITGNTSQMDKLWSILPIAYIWVIAIKGGFTLRLIVFAVIITLWGIRLTFNFARKGAYSIRFWEGKEDYRWAILRQTKPFNNRIVWAIFDFLFISLYQNALVLAITLPALASMEVATFGAIDIFASIMGLAFLVLETVADEYQWKFYTKRDELLKDGKTLAEIESPYNKGFNTLGVWSVMRHPNYLGEQGIWCSLYFMSVGAGICKFGIFNWSIIGPLLLIFLFMGSSAMGEKITKGKYGEYADHQSKVFKYLPIKKYR